MINKLLLMLYNRYKFEHLSFKFLNLTLSKVSEKYIDYTNNDECQSDF